MNRNVGISILCNISYSISKRPCAGCRVVRIDLLRFLAGCHTRWLNQVLSVLYLSMLFIVLLIRAPFLCIISFHWYVLCLSVVLVKLSVLAKWLARKTPLKKPKRGEEIVSSKPRLKSVYDLWSCPQLYVIYFILLWHNIQVTCLCWKCH